MKGWRREVERGRVEIKEDNESEKDEGDGVGRGVVVKLTKIRRVRKCDKRGGDGCVVIILINTEDYIALQIMTKIKES